MIMQAVVSWSEGDFYSEEEEELIEEPPPPVENSPVCIISLKTRLIEALVIFKCKIYCQF